MPDLVGHSWKGVFKLRHGWSPPHRSPLSGTRLSRSAAHWLTAPAPRPRPRRPRQLTRAYWHNHRSQLFCLATYAGLHVLLFALAASAHRDLGASVMVAKGCGQCLNFDCSFIAVGSASTRCSENVN